MRAQPGIVDVRPYTKEESSKLLEPWLGTGLSLDDLPVPRMIVAQVAPGTKLDLDGLRSRVTQVVPSVSVDDHRAWIDRMRSMTGATVFAEKMAGALAESGGALADVAGVAKEVNERSRSFGVALTACTVPSAGRPTFDLGDDEIELGIGIHGERGRERTKLRTASEIVDVSLSAIDEDMPLSGSSVLVMVNGMGFARPLDFEPMLKTPGFIEIAWKAPIHLIAAGLGVEVEEIRGTLDRELTDRDIEVAFGTIPAGTCGAVRR